MFADSSSWIMMGEGRNGGVQEKSSLIGYFVGS